MMRCVLAPALLGLALSGCNPGGASVSGSGSESAGSSSGLSGLWEKVKSLGIETGKTYEMPAVGIMADAFLADTNARRVNLDVGACKRSVACSQTARISAHID